MSDKLEAETMRRTGRWGSRRRREAQIDEAAEIIGRLRRLSREGALIIVEGERDEEILRDLGVEGEILRYSEMGRMRIIKTLEERSGERVVILTDFDEEGEEILGRLEAIALHYGLKIDKQLRKRLFETLHPHATCVEEIRKFREEINRRHLTSLPLG